MTARESGPLTNDEVGAWTRLARGGSAEALGQLLEVCRPYLLLVASQELPPDLRGKIGASDLVQETCLRAHTSFDDFRDAGLPELVAWLRRILLNSVVDLKRRYCATGKRQLSREVSSPIGVAAESLNLPAPGPSPSSAIGAAEQDAALRDALERLPEQYRQVVLWRNYERLPFEEIGGRLGRSAEAARKLWVRAVEQLQESLGKSDEC
jgi:RNA polymerase sigma-70 factor (ECF subfamily)